MEKEKFQLNQMMIHLEVDFQLNYENKVIGKQKNIINFQKDNLMMFQNQEHFVYLKILKK